MCDRDAKSVAEGGAFFCWHGFGTNSRANFELKRGWARFIQ